MNNNYVVIMAGGIGSRFWPFSREKRPKQFQDILGVGRTMIQQTVDRFEGVCPKENIYIVTSKDYKEITKEQLPFLSDDQILLEPCRRNTAPCVAYAAYKIGKKDPDANIVVAPADHVILDVPEFQLRVEKALHYVATHDILITLGIRPNRPDTGYGYIQALNDERLEVLYKVKTFTEKPNEELARAFVLSGDFVWNAGIFVWNAKAIKKAIETHLQDVHQLFSSAEESFYTSSEEQKIDELYHQCRDISIDYGIMEHAENVYVMRTDFGWSDLGTWKSLYEQADKNQEENVLHGNVMSYETFNTIVKTPKDKLVVVQGLENYIVAEYDNVLMICEKDHEQRVKQFLANAKDQKGKEFV
ncbi:mannose-1-phosphate guanylyltransferase [Flammeovirga aprica]|uniref:mannose-1-phosphate guanylyltransferase n=1 Tax=Flammeovirga aprica JL-4 TaxID=694437 RepID=A0A7X9P2Z0_9BACT|nr:mannose-1-phosphate guanylyltransferase [Flammeovirga aprica]NME67679.1 mannose-1-phosphate guanylyltransferase [Flammeovirga aprica JL-4]